MLEILANIFDEQSQLENVSYVLFKGNSQFITAVELRLKTLTFNLRANADDDTLSVSLGAIKIDPDETLIKKDDSDLWISCKGADIAWLWRLTNQQGYDDGLRLEFNNPKDKSRIIVEFIVTASAIEIYSSIRNKTI